MKRRHVIALSCLSMLLGCVPKQRIVWSPDGSRAAVLSNKRLQLINGDGDVLPARFDVNGQWAAWTSDGRHLIVAHLTKAKAWDQVAPHLTEEQGAAIREFAASIRKRAMEFEGDWDDFDLDPDSRLSSGMQVAAVVYLREHLADGIPQKVGDRWADVKKLTASLSHLQVFEFVNGQVKPRHKITTSVDAIRRLRISPDDRKIAYVADPWHAGHDNPALHAVPIAGGQPRQLADNVALGFDWSPDSQSIALIRSSVIGAQQEQGPQLGALATIRITDAEKWEWSEPDDLAGLLFGRAMGVRWLRDGRLVFSALEVHLPATTSDMPQNWSLFALDPRMSASVHRLIGRDFDESLDIPLFQISPDESRVLLPARNGQVVLYEFATGHIIHLIDDARSEKTIMLPSWRGNSEVTYATLDPSDSTGKAGRVMCWKDGQSREISAAWPEEMKALWLTP